MAGIVNSLEVEDWLALEAVRLLKNELFIAGGMNTDYASEYEKEFAPGETVRIPLPWRPIGGEGMSYQPEPIDRRHFTTTVDKVPHVHFEYGTTEDALRMVRGNARFSEQIIKPCMQKMRQKIELYAGQQAAIMSPNVTGTLGTDPTTLGFAATARTRMLQYSGWTGAKRTAAISPSVMQAIAQATTVTTPLFHPGDEIATAFVEGYLGKNGGFEFAESMSLMTITAGVRNGAVSVNTTSVNGDTSIVLTCTTGDTFFAGEKFSIAGRFPVNPGTLQQASSSAITFAIAGISGQTFTGAGSAVTLPLSDSIEGPGSAYQNVTTLPTAGDVITMWPGTVNPNGLTGTLSVLFNRDAFAMVPVKISNPKKGAEMTGQYRDPETGLSVAFVRAFDWVERRWINRFDALLGFGNFYVRNCSMVLAGA